MWHGMQTLGKIATYVVHVLTEMRQSVASSQPLYTEAALALAPQVLCARGVLAMDMNGLSDPYCKAR